MRSKLGLVIGVLAMLAATTAAAQDVQMKAPQPERERQRRVLTPGLLYETKPSDELHYPGTNAVPYDPAFIAPLSRKIETPTSTGRMGIAGWTSPNTPVGPSTAGSREINGWPSFGFSWTWGGPPPAPARAGLPSDHPSALAR
jgi:hypothetical protein